MAKRHDIIWLESVDSTNEECRRRISDIDNLSVVAALSQRVPAEVREEMSGCQRRVRISLSALF